MARTRTQIKALIRLHTGRTKDDLESYACDSALKLAVQAHPFWDSITTTHSDFELTEDATSEDISSASAEHVLTARIVETDGSRNTPLKIKNRVWWDSHIVNADDNTKGWPVYCMHIGDYVYFDRPLQSGLTLRIRESTAQVFALDATACPIACLDLFVEEYATAEVFLSITDNENYWSWRRRALGPDFDRGKVGGTLLRAINFDKYGLGENVAVEEPNAFDKTRSGISVLNLLDDSYDRYGEVDSYF